MYVYNFQIATQEVPGEISLCFSISGCPLRCKGCHSPFLWKEKTGELLTTQLFNTIINTYNGYATCVLFMGGEWHTDKLIELLKYAKNKGYKTCLYTGEETICNNVKQHLNWLKTGPWIESLGGLNSRTTNQKFIEVHTNQTLNHLFYKN
ncbi:MAG: anaerobic ribonucleoside-triphosphate reductase activating protein [Flavobacteriaceae bacterium]